MTEGRPLVVELTAEEFAKIKPRDAVSVIVAEYVENRSFVQADYHDVQSVFTVVIAFTRNLRNDFSEMRKAAAMFAPTAHLGRNRSSRIEHREKFAFGRGCFLKDGNSYSTGWEVRKGLALGRPFIVASYLVPAGMGRPVSGPWEAIPDSPSGKLAKTMATV